MSIITTILKVKKNLYYMTLMFYVRKTRSGVLKFINFPSLRFCVKSIMENLEVLKMPFWGSEFVDLVNYSPQKVQKFIKNQTSESLNV